MQHFEQLRYPRHEPYACLLASAWDLLVAIHSPSRGADAAARDCHFLSEGV